MTHRFLYKDDLEKEVPIGEGISEIFFMEGLEEGRCFDETWIQRERLEVRQMSFVCWKTSNVRMVTMKEALNALVASFRTEKGRAKAKSSSSRRFRV